MNGRRTTMLFATLALAVSAQAQTCSGGADGGMDATGNTCGTVVYAAADVGATLPARPLDVRSVQRAAPVTRTAAASVRRPTMAARSTGSLAAPGRVATTAPDDAHAVAAGPVPR